MFKVIPSLKRLLRYNTVYLTEQLNMLGLHYAGVNMGQ